MLVRLVRTRIKGPLPEGLWLVDEDDAAAIGMPLANIAARKAPVSGEGAKDVGDGIAIVTGTAGYVLKNLQAEADLEPEPAGDPLPAPPPVDA